MKRVFSGVLVLLCAAPAFAAAHSLGASLERTVAEYWIDIGYDPPQVIGGDRIVFDFNLADAVATSTRAEFDYVWVRLQNEKRTLLASGVHRADIGPTTLLITVPKDAKGDLNLSVRYQKDEDTLAESDFTIPVTPYEDLRWWWPFAGVGGIGLMLGALGMAAFEWKKHRWTNDRM